MSKLKKTALALSMVAAAGGSYYAGKQNPDKMSPGQLVEASGKKQWVAYSRTSFLSHKTNFQAQSQVSSLSGVSIKEPMSEINGFVFEASNEQVAEMQRSVGALGIDWVVTEDRQYKLDFVPALLGCAALFLSGCPGKEPPPIDETPTDPVIPWGIEKVKALEAHKVTKARNILVCVADTGTDIHHPDIKNMLAGGKSFVPNSSGFDDDQGHGTHVAGTIAAEINGRDVVGVSQAKIYTVKVLDWVGIGYGSWIANGIVECVNAGADIISMSLGSPRSAGPDILIADAINYALSEGVKVVAAAGNDGKGVGYPAAQPGVIAVSASDEHDRLASFSSRGPEIQYMAPGVDVLSLRNGGGVVAYSGTSMATPHVSGALALALSVGKDLKADNVGLPKEQQGKGRVNALRTVSE